MAKSPNAFRTISEAAEEVGAPQHVLRFWETKFTFITPVKRAGGRRFYRPQDILVLKGVRRLLHEQGLTIKGVQRLYKEQGLARVAGYGDSNAAFSMQGMEDPEMELRATLPNGDNERLHSALEAIEAARARLERVLSR